MFSARPTLLCASLMVSLGLTGSAVMAQSGGWGWEGSGGGGSNWNQRRSRVPQRSASSEGKIEVTRFRAAGDAALTLAHGPISVGPMHTDVAGGAVSIDAARAAATFEAAVEDQLIQAGYSAARTASAGQLAEVRVVRTETEPPEALHKPLSGEMSVGVSNYGTSLGGALYYDGSKPRPALIATRLEARIRDRVSGQVLWEGRAEIATRAGDVRWTEQTIASKLSARLFSGFPARTGEERNAR